MNQITIDITEMETREFKCWQIRYREAGKSETRTTKHLGHLTEAEVIKFFGLNDPDVEWYDIKELKC